MGEARRRKILGKTGTSTKGDKPGHQQVKEWLYSPAIKAWLSYQLNLTANEVVCSQNTLWDLLRKDLKHDPTAFISFIPQKGSGVNVLKWNFWAAYSEVLDFSQTLDLMVVLDYSINAWGQNIVPELFIRRHSSRGVSEVSYPAPAWTNGLTLREIWHQINEMDSVNQFDQN